MIENKYYLYKITDGMSPEMAAIRIAIYKLRKAAFEHTAKKHNGDASHKWRKEKCIRGHPRHGPEARLRTGNGKSDCLICADYLRKQKRQEQIRQGQCHQRGCTAKLYFAFGREQTIKQWAYEFHMKEGSLRGRIYQQKMTLEQALTIRLHTQGSGYCKNGHEMNGWNLFVYGVRKQTKCRICFYARKRQYYMQWKQWAQR